MFSTDFIFRQQENLVDNQKCWAGFRPLCNKILLSATSTQFSDFFDLFLHWVSVVRGRDDGGVHQVTNNNTTWISFPDFFHTLTAPYPLRNGRNT